MTRFLQVSIHRAQREDLPLVLVRTCSLPTSWATHAPSIAAAAGEKDAPPG
uniref:Uncharacterized protein n=1 Tax=Arundo donax TaxID=35708 RepID=A0A0A9BZZ3_ARUDO